MQNNHKNSVYSLVQSVMNRAVQESISSAKDVDDVWDQYKYWENKTSDGIELNCVTESWSFIDSGIFARDILILILKNSKAYKVIPLNGEIGDVKVTITI